MALPVPLTSLGLQGAAKVINAFLGTSLGPANIHCALPFEPRQMTVTLRAAAITLISGPLGRWPLFLNSPYVWTTIYFVILPFNIY